MEQQLDQIQSALNTLRTHLVNPGKTHIVIHHSTGIDRPTADWGGIRRYHVDERKYNDIGYQYGCENVDGYYEILVGRFEHQQGAHCLAGNMNRLGIGICVIGNFELAPPPPAQWQRCLGLVLHLSMRLQIPRSHVVGHGEVPGAATACPGKFWDMDRFRREL